MMCSRAQAAKHMREVLKMNIEIMNRALEAYIEKLESENAEAKQVFSEISNVLTFDGSRPNRTDSDILHEIVGVLHRHEISKGVI